MDKSYLSYSQNFVTAVDEMDYRELLKPSAVLQYFQDLATTHAILLGIGYKSMFERGMCWVISRLSYRVNKYPALGDEIKVTTYPKKPRIVDVNRDYYITDKNGCNLISGTSKWCVIGVEDRAIKKCRELFPFAEDEYNPGTPFDDGNGRVKPLSELNAEIKHCGEYTVGITDLDRNRHMNNARYGDIVLNACTMDELNGKSIKSFDINFISELLVGDRYKVERADSDSGTYFEAVKADGGAVVFRAHVGWEKREV